MKFNPEKSRHLELSSEGLKIDGDMVGWDRYIGYSIIRRETGGYNDKTYTFDLSIEVIGRSEGFEFSFGKLSSSMYETVNALNWYQENLANK
ncbi:MAG: hypothetical protein SchgKO_12590 [Schleiferiaceae bacterium]